MANRYRGHRYIHFTSAPNWEWWDLELKSIVHMSAIRLHPLQYCRLPYNAMPLRIACRACARQQRLLRRYYSIERHSRDYNGAVEALNSLQSNFSVVEAIRKAGPGWNKLAIPEMTAWVKRIGYEVCVTKLSIQTSPDHGPCSRPTSIS